MNHTDLNRFSPPASDESNDYSDVEDDDSDMSGGASPSHRQRAEFTEMKEQMYQDKLADLKRQLAKLNDGSLAEWQKKLRRLDSVYRERLRYNEVVRDLEVEMVEQEPGRRSRAAPPTAHGAAVQGGNGSGDGAGPSSAAPKRHAPCTDRWCKQQW